jgi:D-arabinose 1-dehydrogenase-like Zn-dependent alcohol dehydrogenase
VDELGTAVARCGAGNADPRWRSSQDGLIDASFVRHPLVLGHEWSGAVISGGGDKFEAAAVALRAIERINPRPRAQVLVIGHCTVGLLAVRFVRLWEPGSLTLAGQRDVQARLAATARVDEFSTGDSGRGFDFVFETAGAATAGSTSTSW